MVSAYACRVVLAGGRKASRLYFVLFSTCSELPFSWYVSDTDQSGDGGICGTVARLERVGFIPGGGTSYWLSKPRTVENSPLILLCRPRC